MSSATDKFIQKKLKEFAAKGETADNNILFHARWSKPIYALAAMLGLMSIAFFVLSETKNEGALKILALLAFVGAAWLAQRGRASARLYDLVDTYREALLEKRLRSITDFATLINSSPDEIVDELKELQEVGLFRHFSIDRKNKMFIENANWGEAGSGKFKHVTFSCKPCGANNTIYIDESSTVGTCEYCGSSANI